MEDVTKLDGSVTVSYLPTVYLQEYNAIVPYSYIYMLKYYILEMCFNKKMICSFCTIQIYMYMLLIYKDYW